MTPTLKAFAISLLRKGTFRWKARGIAKSRAKVSAGHFSTGKEKFEYVCEICSGRFKSKDVVLDHKDPVVPLEGFKSGMEFDFNEYIERMFCGEDGFSVLCNSCHDSKTRSENITRRGNKKK